MICNSQLWKNVLRLSRIKYPKITNFRWKCVGYTNLGLLTIYCDTLTDFTEINNEKLSHQECIKQACMISANSATTLLTTATTATLDVCLRYKKVLSHVLGLYEELLLTQGANSEIWASLVESRGEVDKMKTALREMNSYMTSVEKVVNSTTEAAFLAGADYLCTVLCERLHSAQVEITKTIGEIKKLEDDFLKLEEELAKTAKN